jgi:uncharacterized membrane protein YciS (DUF1049 family)
MPGDNIIELFKAACLISSLLGVLIGLGLILRPQAVISVNNFLNTWISTRRLIKAIEKNIDSTAWILKARFISATLFILFSLVLAIVSLGL